MRPAIQRMTENGSCGFEFHSGKTSSFYFFVLTQCFEDWLNTRFPLPTLLHAGYSVKLKTQKLPENRIISEAIHELWSAVVCIGESSAKSIGRVGDVHPTVVPAAAVIKVAGKRKQNSYSLTNLRTYCLWPFI